MLSRINKRRWLISWLQWGLGFLVLGLLLAGCWDGPVDLRGRVVAGGGTGSGTGQPGQILAMKRGEGGGVGGASGASEVGTMRPAGGPAAAPEAPARAAEPPAERPAAMVPQPVEAPIPVRHPGKPIPTPEQMRNWIKDFPTIDGPSTTPQNQYEIRHAGPHNIEIQGAGVTIAADGVLDTGYLQEAKFIDNPKESPFILDSSCDPQIRDIILSKIEGEFRRYGSVINDPQTPVIGLEVITNERRAVPLFEKYMRLYNIPGRIKVLP